jgi:outer membrane receptor protein involved in Fe transport
MTARRPDFAPGKRDNFRLSLKGGSFETVNPSVLWEHRFTPALDASVHAEYLYTSGKYKFSYRRENGYDTTEIRRNGDVRALRVECGLHGTVKEGDWRAKLYYYDSERGYPGASVREEPGRFRHEDRQWDRNLFVQSSFRRHFGRYRLMLSGKYAYDYLHYLSDPRLDETTMYVDNHYRQQEVYCSSANEFALSDGWRVSLATDFQYNTLDANLVNFVHPSRYTLLAAAAMSIESGPFKCQGSLLHTRVHDETRSARASAKDKSEWTPTLVAAYNPRTDLTLRAFYKKIFRMPTLNDLYYTFIGNKNLSPEYTTQYNLGILYTKDLPRGPLRRLDLQFDAYFNQVDDKIIAMPTSNQFQWTMINLGHVEIRGIDAALQATWQPGRVTLATRLTYTYQKARDLTDPTEEWYGGQIPYIPWHGGAAILSATFDHWDLNYSFIYTGERYESRANTPANHAQPWYTHDLSLSRLLPLRASSLRLTAELNNIFNQQYEVVQCYPMPGTNLKIKINWTL